jgi:hypothetical protein
LDEVAHTVWEGIKFVDPKEEEDSAGLDLLRALDKVLASKKTEKLLAKVAQSGDESSARLIQGNRYEIFVQSSFGKKYNVFDQIASRVSRKASSSDVRTALIQFSLRKVASIGKHFSKEKFSCNNFSLLTSYGKCKGQAPHIDLLPPNVQFGLTITDLSPPTLCFQVPTHIQSASDLVETGWPNMSDNLGDELEKQGSGFPELLRGFGNVLHPGIRDCSRSDLLRAGTLAAMSGGKVHAGPPSEKYRSILFFSGQTKGSREPEYNPDTQYSSPVLCADILYDLWLRISVTDREYLLTRLLEYAKQVAAVCSIVDYDCLPEKRTVARFLCEAKKRGLLSTPPSAVGHEDLVCKFAQYKFADLPVMNEKPVTMESLQLVSAPHLLVQWDNGEFFPAVVYKLSLPFKKAKKENEHSVLIYYHRSQPGWEGCECGGYTLTLNSADLFDGENGTLVDSQGSGISCSTSPPQ